MLTKFSEDKVVEETKQKSGCHHILGQGHLQVNHGTRRKKRRKYAFSSALSTRIAFLYPMHGDVLWVLTQFMRISEKKVHANKNLTTMHVYSTNFLMFQQSTKRACELFFVTGNSQRILCELKF